MGLLLLAVTRATTATVPNSSAPSDTSAQLAGAVESIDGTNAHLVDALGDAGKRWMAGRSQHTATKSSGAIEAIRGIEVAQGIAQRGRRPANAHSIGTCWSGIPINGAVPSVFEQVRIGVAGDEQRSCHRQRTAVGSAPMIAVVVLTYRPRRGCSPVLRLADRQR